MHVCSGFFRTWGMVIVVPSKFAARSRFGIAAFVLGLALMVPVSAMATDDTIPGTPASLPYSALDSLNIQDDVSDVYSVYLKEGQWLYALMRCQDEREFAMAVHGPAAPQGAPDFTSGERFSVTIGGVTQQQALRHQATVSGTYHVQVVMVQGSADGNYAMHLSAGRPYKASKPTVPKTVKRGKWFDVKGYITPGYLFEGKSVKVELQKRSSGKWGKKLTHTTAPHDTELGRSEYGARAKLSAGKWRVRASVGDKVQARKYSAWREFTVR